MQAAVILMLMLAASARGAPALPLYDWKACPFEGCAYRQWTARQAAVVYDTWKPTRKVITRLAKGETIVALRGVVITFRPGRIRMDRDLPERHLKRGDVILTYAYRGEGTSSAWVNGRYESDFDISFTKWPDGTGCGGQYCAATYLDVGNKQWWAEVKLPSGRKGYVWMDHAHFDGSDLLAD